MKTIALLLVAALLHAAPSFAQLVAAAPGSGPAVGLRPTPLVPAYSTQQLAGGGSLTYFGMGCSHEAGDAQFAQLRQAFASSRPTVVYVETPDSGLDSTETATIARLGEAGYARFLAQQQHVPTERLDNPVAEYAYLQTQIAPERLKLYCLLRETQRYRVRTGASEVRTKRAMRQLLANSAHFLPGTEQVIRNEAELAAAYRQYCPAGTKWWQAPADWFEPQAAAHLDNPFLRELNTTVATYRAQQVYARLLARAQAGERVLVVMGRAALPAPTPTLAHN